MGVVVHKCCSRINYFGHSDPDMVTIFKPSPNGNLSSQVAPNSLYIFALWPPVISFKHCKLISFHSFIVHSADYFPVLPIPGFLPFFLYFFWRCTVLRGTIQRNTKQNMAGHKIEPNILFLEIIIRLKSSYRVSFSLGLMQGKRLISLVILSSPLTNHLVIWSPWCSQFCSLAGVVG